MNDKLEDDIEVLLNSIEFPRKKFNDIFLGKIEDFYQNFMKMNHW